jgi:hypothetical protein
MIYVCNYYTIRVVNPYERKAQAVALAYYLYIVLFSKI